MLSKVNFSQGFRDTSEGTLPEVDGIMTNWGAAYNNNNNNNNIYRGSPTRQGGFQWGPHKVYYKVQ